MALVTAQEVKTLAFKDDNNIDLNNFTDDYIETIELVYLRPYFQQVFDNIIEKDGVGYTANEQELINRFKKPLTLFCKHDIVPELSLVIGNAGVQSFSSDFSTPVSSRERIVLQNTIMKQAEVLMDDVMRWYNDQDDLRSEETEVRKEFNGDIVL